MEDTICDAELSSIVKLIQLWNRQAIREFTIARTHLCTPRVLLFHTNTHAHTEIRMHQMRPVHHRRVHKVIVILWGNIFPISSGPVRNTYLEISPMGNRIPHSRNRKSVGRATMKKTILLHGYQQSHGFIL